MNKIGAYGMYQNSLVNSVIQNKNKQDIKKTKNANQTKELNLSDAAKELLEKLKKSYGNMDFIVADYDSQEEAEEYLSRGSKEYSVLIEPEILEKMAADESVEEEYLSKLDSATDKLSQMVEQLGDRADEVTHMGVSFSKDGSVSFFAELEKMSEKQKERIQQSREDRKAEEKEAKKKDENLHSGTVKRTKVYADSTKNLLEKIQNLDWSRVRAEEAQNTGRRFNLTV